MRLIRHIAITLGLCAIFAVPSHADSPQLDALATQLVGSPVTVKCFPSNDEYAGFVVMIGSVNAAGVLVWHNDDHTIYLEGIDCGALQNVLTPTKRTARWMRSYDGGATVGQAYMHLTHEATHISLQSGDEGLVECTAYRNLSQTVKLLPLGWKARQAVYEGAKYNHFAKPTTGPDAVYRSVC